MNSSSGISTSTSAALSSAIRKAEATGDSAANRRDNDADNVTKPFQNSGVLLTMESAPYGCVIIEVMDVNSK